jgi:CPA1 family monovalent cation:H+ antiporter
MLLIFTLILVVVLLSRILEERLKWPFALSAITLAYLGNHFFHLDPLGEAFPEIVYLMLPIILIPDVLGVSRTELRQNLGSIVYLSVVAVGIAIALAMGLTHWLAPHYQFTLGMLLALFAPLMATDVVSVSSIFSRFKLPERLKLYAEGESLFNDITAMILFFFVALPLIEGSDVVWSELQWSLGSMVLESVLVGVIIGLIGYYLFKYFSDSIEQFLTIYLMATMAFLVAEHFQLSGILGVVVTILLFKYLFDKEGHYKKFNLSALYQSLNRESTPENSFRAYRKEAAYLGMFANGVIFVAIASIVELPLLWQYKLEILYAFVLTTVLRALLLVPLVAIKKHPWRWSGALTFAGMKGGLAIIMVFSLPASFEYKELFLTVVVGVVILSMFVNTLLLKVFLLWQAEGFALDKAGDHQSMGDEQAARETLKQLLEKDTVTSAYNPLVFEDVIEKEMARAQRYQEPFALLAFEHDDAIFVGSELAPLLRKSDYFGKLGPQRYAILATHSNIDAALIVAQKLHERLEALPIAVTVFATGDTLSMLYEKLEQALSRNNPIDVEL